MCSCPTADLAHNPGMCPDWESNRQPFGSQPALNPLSYTSQGFLSEILNLFISHLHFFPESKLVFALTWTSCGCQPGTWKPWNKNEINLFSQTCSLFSFCGCHCRLLGVESLGVTMAQPAGHHICSVPSLLCPGGLPPAAVLFQALVISCLGCWSDL